MDTTALRPGNFKLYPRIQQHLQAGGPATSGQPQNAGATGACSISCWHQTSQSHQSYHQSHHQSHHQSYPPERTVQQMFPAGLWPLEPLRTLKWKSPFSALCCDRRHRHNGTAPHQHDSRSDYCRLQPCAGRRCARVHAILASQGACGIGRHNWQQGPPQSSGI